MPVSALCTEDLVKRYGKAAALDGVSLAVEPGERVALLGHNGAGKTTLIKLVLGLIPATTGRILVAGAAPGSNEARASTAYLPEAIAFHPSLTGIEQLALFARLSREPVSCVRPLLERVGLAGAVDRRIGGWSKGMRQRLGLAQILLGRPRLAMLDEPTSGLDPLSRHDLYSIIDEIATAGTAVVIASHALTELEARTDRIAILRDGSLVANDKLERLRQRAGLPTRLRITAAEGQADEVQSHLGGQRINGVAVELTCMPDEKMRRLSEITSLGALVTDVEVRPPMLEDLYASYMHKEQPCPPE